MSETDPAGAADAGSNSPGRQLAAAREGCGFAVADIARQLKLSSRQIEALETDNYSSLPGAVFVRGFIRNYARLVKLDPVPLLECPELQLRPVVPAAPELVEPVDIPFSNGRNRAWWKYGLATLALLLPIAYFGTSYDDTAERTDKSRQIEKPLPQVMKGEIVAASTDTQVGPATDAAFQPESPAAAAAQNDGNSIDRQASAGRTVAQVRPNEHQVRLRFERDSWVEIRDRHGRKIFSQINLAGTSQAVRGEPPLTLIVGNAAGVRVTHNDQPVDLAPHIKVDVARLTLE